MTEVRFVGKAMDDLADDWHWVILHNAEELEPRLYLAGHVDTVCGILIVAQPQRIRLFDMGAPSEPTCPRCREGGLSPELLADIEQVLEQAEAAPLEVTSSP
jgi:hypothetical protein